MVLTQDEVKHIANLARLSLTQEEEELYATQLSSIIEYVDQLKEVDTKDLVYGYQVEGLENMKAPDEIHASNEETRKRLLDAMPDRVQDYLRTKGVFH